MGIDVLVLVNITLETVHDNLDLQLKYFYSRLLGVNYV